jgi:hypothetical protein
MCRFAVVFFLIFPLSNCSNVPVNSVDKELDTLKLYNHDSLLYYMPILDKMSNLGYLYVGGFSDYTAINLYDLPELRLFKTQSNQYVTSVSIANCPKLKNIEILYSQYITQINWDTLPSLESIDLQGCTGLGSIADLSKQKNLKSLRFGNAWVLRDISPLSQLKHLTDLNLTTENNILDYSPISALSLERLAIYCNDLIADLSFLNDLKTLRYLALDLGYDSKITDYSPLLDVLSAGDTLFFSQQLPVTDSIKAIMKSRNVVVF